MTSSAKSQLIKGKYCHVICELVGQTSFKEKWMAKYHWDSVGLDVGSDVEQISYFTSNLLDPKLLEDCKNIHNGIGKEWVNCKDICIEIARCFLADKGQQNDPLIDILNIGDIDKFTYDFRWIETELYRNLWMMITSHSQEIISNMKRIWEYPFSSDIELLCRIIQEDLEGEFVVYTQSFYQYHAKELDQIDKLKRKDHRDEITSEEKKLWELIDKSRYPAIWYERLIQVCQELKNAGLESITPYLDVNSDNIESIKGDRAVLTHPDFAIKKDFLIGAIELAP